MPLTGLSECVDGLDRARVTGMLGRQLLMRGTTVLLVISTWGTGSEAEMESTEQFLLARLKVQQTSAENGQEGSTSFGLG